MDGQGYANHLFVKAFRAKTTIETIPISFGQASRTDTF